MTAPRFTFTGADGRTVAGAVLTHTPLRLRVETVAGRKVRPFEEHWQDEVPEGFRLLGDAPEPVPVLLPKFRTLLVDPPWTYVCWGKSDSGRAAADKYTVQDEQWILNLPVSPVAHKDSTLLMWATNPLLPDAFQVIEAWGFKYKSMITWVKMSRAAAPRIGLGFHARACTEHLLIAARGNAPAPPTGERPNGVIFCPRGKHSAKPDFQYDLAENYPGPYLELFHRPREGGLFPPRENWTFLGDAVDNRDIKDALVDLAARVQ